MKQMMLPIKKKINKTFGIRNTNRVCMDKYFDNLERSISEDDGFWFVCNSDGYVNMCSSTAVKYGITGGSGDFCRVIHEECIADLEDVLRIVKVGGEVSVLLDACEETGYTVAHVKNSMLFSEPVAEIRLYKNKNEYLDDPQRNNSVIGRVFGRIDDTDSVSDSINAISTNAEIVKNRILGFQRSALRICSGFGFSENTEASLMDVSEVFDIVAERFSANKRKPFNVEFVNDKVGNAVICFGKTENVVGTVLASAATAVRMSRDGKCRVMLRCDGDSVVIETHSNPGIGVSVCFRSCDFLWLYAATGKGISELAFLEHILTLVEYDAEFMCDVDGDFVIRVTLNKNSDPDRLKFRDGACGADIIADEYIAYLSESFLSDTQQ